MEAGRRASPVAFVIGPGRSTSRETWIEQPAPIGMGSGIPSQLVLLALRASAAGAFGGSATSRKVTVVPITGQSPRVRVAGAKQLSGVVPHPAPKLEIDPAAQGEIVKGMLQNPPLAETTSTNAM